MSEEFKFGTWYPIESAPKDGTPVWVFSPSENLDDPTNFIVAKFVTYGEQSWWSFCELTLADIAGSIDPEPTHWMPLPPSPVTDAAGIRIKGGDGRNGGPSEPIKIVNEN